MLEKIMEEDPRSWSSSSFYDRKFRNGFQIHQRLMVQQIFGFEMFDWKTDVVINSLGLSLVVWWLLTAEHILHKQLGAARCPSRKELLHHVEHDAIESQGLY